MNNKSDFAEADREKAATLLDALIAWTNSDHEDCLTLSRNQCCYMRDEITHLRALEAQLKALDWTPISADNLPRVGDMVWWRGYGDPTCASAELITQMSGHNYKSVRQWLKASYTHRRPINPPHAGVSTGDAE